MRSQTARGVSAIALLSVVASPAAAQYRADVVVTGGVHAGTYTFFRRPPTCSLVKNANGGYTFSLIDTTARGHNDRLANLLVAFGSTENAAAGTAEFRFAIGFGGDPSSQPPALRYDAMNATPASGPSAATVAPGRLTFNFIYGEETFKASLSATTSDGADSVRVSATVACKGVNRQP